MDARTRESLAFLTRIARVEIPSMNVEDDALFLVLDVRMVLQNQSQFPEQQLKKQSKALRPHVDYCTTKAVRTLDLVHTAIHDWSLKHMAQHQQRGANELGAMAQHCAYCSQFNSPAAMELWLWNKPPVQVCTSGESENAEPSVVVLVDELQEFAKCVNSYVKSARNVPAGLQDCDCEGLKHIPSIVASFLQRAQIKEVGMSRFGSVCGAGM